MIIEFHRFSKMFKGLAPTLTGAFLLMALTLVQPLAQSCGETFCRGTGDLGLVIERASGSIQIIETTTPAVLKRIEGLGDLSHASAVFSRDQRYAYIFGRDGGLTKVDLLAGRIDKRIIQAGNSIGGAISQDGTLVAVSNYKPGGVRVFDADSLEPVADIPALRADGTLSKVVGLVDAPGNRFVFTLYDAGEIWVADFTNKQSPKVTKFLDVGTQPYDGLITSDGRYYIAGLFGEDGLVLLDLWNTDKGTTRLLDGYGRGEKPLPVYKMPHLEGWAEAGGKFFLPAVGRYEVLVLDRNTWKEASRIRVQGQPIFAIAQPGGRYVWVTFAHPRNNVVQIIDTLSGKIIKTLSPGKAILHVEFTPRGERAFVSSRDDNRVTVYDTQTLEPVMTFESRAPSGIFLSARAHRTGL